MPMVDFYSLELKKIVPFLFDDAETFTKEDFEHLLEFSIPNLKFPKIRMIKNTKILMPEIYENTKLNRHSRVETVNNTEKIMDLVESGATLVLMNLEEYSAKSKKIVNTLSIHFNAPIHINLYFSKKNAKGFGMHFDDHDIYLFQVLGTKKWGFNPERKVNNVCKKQVNLEKPSSTIEITLKQKDTLYIPRGVWHETFTENISIHLTIGVYKKTIFDYITSQFELLKEEPFVSEYLSSVIDPNTGKIDSRIKKKIIALLSEKI